MKIARVLRCNLVATFAMFQIAMADGAEPPVDFDREIRPLLSDACYTCHGPDEKQRKADLRLDTREGAFADLGGRHAIVAGKLEASELYQRVTSTDDSIRMPPADAPRKLTAREIDFLRRWIEAGAAWEEHWAFIPPQRPTPPQVTNARWPRNAIDHFILERLEREGLPPSAEASKETLIRRLTLDLTGLPPTIAEVDAFLADESSDAYERLVDRLLASPDYGEQMALPWLDAARYSDTNGYQTDGTRAMWPWRDWLIDALNGNIPFDRFTVEQIAGDMLPDPALDQLIATGFNRNHMLNGEGGRIAEESRVEYVVDRLETTGTVWLGLTIGCGRCHDHKYDPISQKEFYGMYAYFNNVTETGAVDRRSSTAAPTLELPTEQQKAERERLQKSVNELDAKQKDLDKALLAAQPEWEESARENVANLPEPIAAVLKLPADKRNDEQMKQLADHYLAQSPARQAVTKRLDDARKKLNDLNNAILITMIMEDRQEPRETFVLVRGEYDKPGDKVQPGVPASLPPLPEGGPNNRLGFARWLVDRRNPLTARVTVNRYWQQFFGTGLVKTTEDFGTQGERPSHPQLLDWLATELMRDWDVKRMHKLLLMSATYRQSSRTTPELVERDPENRLLARGPRFRRSSYEIRDQALALAGLLVDRKGGPPVKPYQPPGIWEDFSFGKIVYKQDHGADLYRRSLYTFWRRSVGPTAMFDTSARQVCTVRARRNNTPLHSLILFNDVTFAETARAFGQRMLKEGGSVAVDRVRWGFRLATARFPTSTEEEILLKSYERLLSQYRDDRDAAAAAVSVGEAPRDESLDVVEHAACTGIASVILNLDEVLNRE